MIDSRYQFQSNIEKLRRRIKYQIPYLFKAYLFLLKSIFGYKSGNNLPTMYEFDLIKSLWQIDARWTINFERKGWTNNGDR